MKTTFAQRPCRVTRSTRSRQHGVVMLFGLIALAIMLIGTAAMVRSMNTSMFNAGNLGFKRDMGNQMERAISLVTDALRSGSLSSDAARQANLTASNYRATLLASNAQGIPNALLSDSVFTSMLLMTGIFGAASSVSASRMLRRSAAGFIRLE